MGSQRPIDSPLTAAADVPGERTTEAFSLLGNETRLAILLALWEAQTPRAEESVDPVPDTSLSFSELRDRVGMEDSSQFNYHLDRLAGIFVESSDGGYELLPAGNRLVRTIVASAGFDDVSLETREIDLSCWHCGSPTAITYQNQRLYHVCTECSGSFDLSDKHPPNVLAGYLSNPAALTDRPPEEIYTAAATNVFHDFGKRAAGICPDCTGPIESRLRVCEDHQPPDVGQCPNCGSRPLSVAQFACPVCGHRATQSVQAYTGHHPAMIAFAWQLGFHIYRRDPETIEWLARIKHEAEEELVSEDPPRVRITFRAEDHGLQMTYDEELAVIESQTLSMERE